MPGSISVTRTPVPFELQPRRLAHRRDRPLRRRVERARAAPGGRRRDPVSSRWPARLAQGRHRRADRERGPVDVRQHHRAPVLRASRPGSREWRRSPRSRRRRRGGRTRSSAAGDQRLLLVPLGHVAGDGEARSGPPSSAASASSLSVRAGGEHDAVAGLRGVASGRGADAARGAGDQEDGVGHDGPFGRSAWHDGRSHADRSRTHPRDGGAGRRRLPELPPRGPRAQGRPGRRRRRPRRRRRARGATTRCATSARSGAAPTSRRGPWRSRPGLAAPRADGDDVEMRVAPGTVAVAGGRHPATTSCGRASGRWSPGAARAAAATSASPGRSGRRRDSPSAGSPARRAGSTCASSCSPTSGSWGCRTPASPRCSRA